MTPTPLSRLVFRNTSWLLSGQLIGRLLRAVLIIYAARLLGAESFGAFSYALSIAALVSIAADLGINALITREESGLPADKPGRSGINIISAGLTLKTIAVSAFVILIFIFRNYLAAIPEAAILLPAVAIIFAFDSFRDFGAAIARARNKMSLEAAAVIATNLAIVIFGFIALALLPTAYSLAWGYALGAALGALLMAIFIFPYLPPIKLASFARLKSLLVSSLPFATVTVMGAVMINTDIILLGWLSTPTATGLYSAAQKPIQLLYLLPALVAAGFFPVLSAQNGNRHRFRLILKEGIIILITLAVPATLVGAIAAPSLIALLYGANYAAAAAPFAILSLSLLFVFPSMMLSNAAFALGRERDLIVYSLTGFLGNLILDILLIPSLGIVGSALATLINQIVINIYLYRRLQKTEPFSIAPRLIKIALAALATATAAFILSSYTLPVLIVPPLIYLIVLLILREPILYKILSLLKSK